MPTEESLLKLINEVEERLEQAISQAAELSYKVGKVGRAKGLLAEFEQEIFEKRPELKQISYFYNELEPKLTEERYS